MVNETTGVAIPPTPETSDPLHEKLRFYEVWERLINRISPQLCRVIDLDNFLRATVTEIGRLMDVDRCNLMVYSENRTLKIDYEYLRDPLLPSAINQQVPVKRDFLLSSTYKYEPYIANDIETQNVHPVVRQLCAAFGTRSLFIMPISLGERLLAVIGLHHNRGIHRWREEEINFIRSLANQLAVAYQYAELYGEKEREVKISRLLLSLIDELQQRKSMDDIISFLLDRSLELVTADSACFGYFDLPGLAVHFPITRTSAHRPAPTELPDKLAFTPDNALFLELKKGNLISIADDSSLAHDGYRLKKAFRASTLLVCPLLINGALFGVIVFLWQTHCHTPAGDDRPLLESIWRQACLYFERNQLNSEILHLRQRLRQAQAGEQTSPISPLLLQADQAAADLAPADCTILIIGESGSGRTRAAERIHQLSRREGGPFRKINCRRTDPAFFFRKLVGHAFEDREGKEFFTPGILESSVSGTLFFHEIDALPMAIQEELAESIQNGYFYPEGSRRKLVLNHRLLFSATPAPDMPPASSFHPALWALIGDPIIRLPALRECGEDLPRLANSFIDGVRRETGRFLAGFDEPALQTLAAHSWPGNLRELRLVVEKTARQARTPLITVSDLAGFLPNLNQPGPEEERSSIPIGQSLAEIEQAAILQTLEACGGDKQRTSRLLKIGRKTLYRKLQTYRDQQKKKIKGSS